MIKIHRGYVSDLADRSIMFTDIEVDEEPQHVLIAVNKAFGKFLSPERADYALVGLLAYAMRNKHDIICEAPVTDELLYKIREILIPTLVRTDQRNYPVKIQANIAPPLDKLLFVKTGRSGIGTGLSFDVDNLYSILKYLNCGYPAQNLTHLSFFNVDAIKNGKINITADAKKVLERAAALAADVKLPLLQIESNFQEIFPQDALISHTYTDALAIYALQKLWQTYYYSSSHFFADFSLKNNFDTDPGYFEPLLLDCLSTSKLKIFSEGSECARDDKLSAIVDSPLTQKYLHVCNNEGHNCGGCEKCLRTMLCLDALGKLNKFAACFDLAKYNQNRGKIYVFLYEQFILKRNYLYGRIYSVLSARHKDFFASLDAKVKTQLKAQGIPPLKVPPIKVTPPAKAVPPAKGAPPVKAKPTIKIPGKPAAKPVKPKK